MSDYYILDSNILSQIVIKKPNKHYLLRLNELVLQEKQIILSPIVLYEVERGLRKVQATKQLEIFEYWVRILNYYELDQTVWREAVKLWVIKEQTGNSGVNDADVIIAAQAKALKATVVTNDKPLQKLIPNQYEDWQVKVS